MKIKQNWIKNKYKNAETLGSPFQEMKRNVNLSAKKEKKKKKPGLLSAVTSGVTTPKSFLLQAEGAVQPSSGDELVGLSTGSGRLFDQRTTTKNTKFLMGYSNYIKGLMLMNLYNGYIRLISESYIKLVLIF